MTFDLRGQTKSLKGSNFQTIQDIFIKPFWQCLLSNYPTSLKVNFDLRCQIDLLTLGGQNKSLEGSNS